VFVFVPAPSNFTWSNAHWAAFHSVMRRPPFLTQLASSVLPGVRRRRMVWYALNADAVEGGVEYESTVTPGREAWSMEAT